MTPYKALSIAQEFIAKELNSDEIPYDPVVCSNLFQCYNNIAPSSRKNGWQLFLAHVCWPEENEFPEHMFLVSQENVPGYTRLMNRIEEMYDES